MVEQPALRARDDGVADPAERDARGVEAEAANEAVGDDDARENEQHVGAAIEEDQVDQILDDPGVQRCGRRR